MKNLAVEGIAVFFCLFGCSAQVGAGSSNGGVVGKGSVAYIGGEKKTLIKGSSGTIAGGLISASLDEQERNVMDNHSPRTVERMDRGDPLTVNDIIKLHEGGISDEIIIRYIHDTRTTYNLSQAQIRKLQHVGVSQRVLNHMIDSGR